ncbi:MAG: hypothetical protein A4E73_01006 [Syntrophaceae bacterium PtaU1.Bin231]|nr:MAG: hypothetical protein A4E73_01006 [Syntrophaceae bacterium PtaU1.Bin231]
MTFGLGALSPNRQWKLDQKIAGGGYTGTPRSWAFYLNDPVLASGLPNPSFIPLTGTDFMTVRINEPVNNAFDGVLAGASVDWISATAYVTGGAIKGTFDPTTWTAVSMGTILPVAGFIDRVNALTDDAARLAFEKATKIPAFEVGRVDLTYSNPVNPGLTSVNMNNVTFFTTSTDTARANPTLWATKEISGTYNVTPVNPVTLTGGTGSTAISATFNPVRWDNNKWGAAVNGGGTLTNVNNATLNVNFKGGAAGTYSGGNFGGTGAGVVKAGEGAH